MPHHWHHSQSLALAALAWTAMMAVMMAPTVAPWVLTYHRVLAARASGRERRAGVALFAAGYVAVWSLFGVAAAMLQVTIEPPAFFGGALLVGAGLFQLSPLKQACLSHCRNPLSFLLARWRNGPASGFRLGVLHGLYCVGCCWALMLTALAMGVMNLAWMAALAVATFVEQATPIGARVRVPLGFVLIAIGFAVGVFGGVPGIE